MRISDWSSDVCSSDLILHKQRILNKSSGGMQAFFMNTRRDRFKDPRVREALAYAFDFQWTNKTVYYGQYEQPASFFAPTELACSGLPQGEELEILERYRGRVPEEVFTTPYVPPKTDGSGWPRRSEEHTSELQSLMRISYAVFCLKKKKQVTTNQTQ